MMIISFSYKRPLSPKLEQASQLRRSVEPPSPILLSLVTEVLLSSTKLGFLDRLGTVDGSLSVTLSAEAVLVFEHGARVGDGSARAPEVGVEGEY